MSKKRWHSVQIADSSTSVVAGLSHERPHGISPEFDPEHVGVVVVDDLQQFGVVESQVPAPPAVYPVSLLQSVEHFCPAVSVHFPLLLVTKQHATPLVHSVAPVSAVPDEHVALAEHVPDWVAPLASLPEQEVEGGEAVVLQQAVALSVQLLVISTPLEHEV